MSHDDKWLTLFTKPDVTLHIMPSQPFIEATRPVVADLGGKLPDFFAPPYVK